MSEWKKVKLGDCCEITSSKRCHASERSKEGIPFYCSKEIILLENGEEVRDSDFIPVELYESIKHKYDVPKPGDLLLTTRGTNGIPYIYKDKDCFYFADGNLSWFKNFQKELSVRYLYYWFKSHIGKHSVDSIAKGTAQKAVPIDGLRNLDIELPPFTIQHRIAAILSRYDSLIENYQKQIKLLEEAAQRLYKEWFVDLHFPGHENTKIVNGVPEGWEKKKIEEFAAIKSGFAFKSKDWQGFGCPVVKIKDINGTFVLSGSLDCVPIFVAEKANQYILRTGDLVIAMTGATIGKIGIVTEDDLYANQRVGKFFVKDRFILPFLFCYFKEKSTIDLVLKISSSSAAQPNISGSQLGSFDFMYNKELFDKFCDIVQNPFHKIILLQNQIRLLTEARDRLLPKLMSGEIAV